METSTENAKFVARLLQYRHAGGWRTLPEWCVSYMDMGAEMSIIPSGHTPTRIVLSLPALNYAAVFAALGAMLASSSNLETSSEYLEMVRSLPPGTPIRFITSTNAVRGLIEEFPEVNGISYVVIRTGKRETRRYTLLECASRIRISENHYNLRNYQQGRQLPSISELLGACVPNASEFATKTGLDLLVIGQIAEFQSEATDTVIRVEEGGVGFQGCPQDILRIREFLGPNHAYRSLMLASSSDPSELGLLDGQTPPVVIFRGSNAYLRHWHKWERANHIVLLARTDRGYEDAVNDLNRRYLQRSDTSPVDFAFEPPGSVDTMVFQEHAFS